MFSPFSIEENQRSLLMSWFLRFIDSSVGKKLVMALTGLFIILFLVEHLAANLLLLVNDRGKIFMEYSEFMASSLNIPIRIIEVGLFFFLFYHTVNGVRLWWGNRAARGVNYKTNNPSENSTFFSRFMIYSGSIVFIFLVIHLRTFFWSYRIEVASNTMYEGVVEAFSNPYYSGFYILALILLAFHLVHGFQSSFQTLGIRHNKYTSFIKGFGIVFSILLCAGFAVVPLYFLFNGGGN
jgi:succinate dehydrogenase / fumarate reductase cytochrome b subunit